MRLIVKYIVCVYTVLTFLSACSLISLPREETKDDVASDSSSKFPTEVPVKALEENKASNVELIWQVSDELVDAFVIRYGTQRENLNQQLRVDPRTVERFRDSQYGQVYRYVIRDIPPGQSIFVEISSMYGGVMSKPSPVFEVKAEYPATP